MLRAHIGRETGPLTTSPNKERRPRPRKKEQRALSISTCLLQRAVHNSTEVQYAGHLEKCSMPYRHKAQLRQASYAGLHKTGCLRGVGPQLSHGGSVPG